MNSIVQKVEHLWDPLKRNLWKGMYGPTTPNVKRFLKAYRKNPQFFLLRQILCTLPGVLFLLIPFFPGGMWLWNTIVEAYEVVGIYLLFSILLLVMGWNYALYSPLKAEITAAILADQMGWESFDHSIQKHWMQMKTTFREIFNKGSREQAFLHQFWGMHEEVPFWIAEWHYTTDTGKGRSIHTTKTVRQVVAIPFDNPTLVGQTYADRTGWFYIQKGVAICILEDLFFDDLRQSLFFAEKASITNKGIIEQKMCSVLKFKDTAVTEIQKKIKTLECS